MKDSRLPPLAKRSQELLELESIAAKLLATARKLPRGEIRQDFLKEIGRLRARIGRLRNDDEPVRPRNIRKRGRRRVEFDDGPVHM